MESSQAPKEVQSYRASNSGSQLVGKTVLLLIALVHLGGYLVMGYILIDPLLTQNQPNATVKIKDKQIDSAADDEVRVWFAHNGQNKSIWAGYGEVLEVEPGEEICLEVADSVLSKRRRYRFSKIGKCV